MRPHEIALKVSARLNIAAFIVTAIAVAGCTTSDPTAPLPASSQVTTTANSSAAPFLTASQFRNQIVGNTLTGRIANFPGVGPIRFKIHYAANGTLSDFLTFERNGTTGRDTGVWRVESEAGGIICYRYRKRLGSAEQCVRYRMGQGGSFEQVPTVGDRQTISGRVLPGDQT